MPGVKYRLAEFYSAVASTKSQSATCHHHADIAREANSGSAACAPPKGLEIGDCFGVRPQSMLPSYWQPCYTVLL